MKTFKTITLALLIGLTTAIGANAQTYIDTTELENLNKKQDQVSTLKHRILSKYEEMKPSFTHNKTKIDAGLKEMYHKSWISLDRYQSLRKRNEIEYLNLSSCEMMKLGYEGRVQACLNAMADYDKKEDDFADLFIKYINAHGVMLDTFR